MGKEYEQAGMSFDVASERVARFEEALHVFKGLFAPEPVTFSGKYYTITGIQGFPSPLQHPHPPILIGAGGRRMLALAAREADIVGILAGPLNAGEPTPSDPAAYSAESLSRKIAWLREVAGERFSQLELSVLTNPRFTSNRLQVAEQIVQERGWSNVSAEEILKMPTFFIGTVDEVAEQMLERRERFGISYYMTFDRVMEACAPLVARLAGR
jgi:probable F420-dependent oxidoreductase